MISDLDRRILARATNTPWHELVSDKLGVLDHFTCSCGKEYVSKGAFLEHLIRCGVTFSTPDDWEMVRVKVILPNILLFESIIYDNGIQWWLQKTSHELCQTTVDIIQSRPDLFPWVEEMMEEKK
jgi:hypothetical protein